MATHALRGTYVVRPVDILDTAERVILVGLYGLLASRLLPDLTAKPFNLLYLIAEAMVVLLIVFRRPATQVSGRAADWVVAFTGTLLPLLVVRSDGAGIPAGALLMVVGFSVSVTAQLSLRRSFGVVAANRGVKTAGLYEVVRHPMYAGYFLTNAGFLLVNPTAWNAAICLLFTTCQLYRIRAEERVLSSDPAYVEFRQRVRYRLFPLLY